MAWETGTAAGHEDLMDKFRTFITSNADLVAAGQNWTELEWSESLNPGSYTKALAIKGPGSSPGDEVFASFVCRDSSVAGQAANWWMWAQAQWETGVWDGSSPGAVTQSRGIQVLSLTEASLDYWFFANGRRFIVVAKIGTGYYSAHMGWGLPFATPTQYPYPYYSAGNYCNYRYRDYTYNDNTVINSSFFAPCNYDADEGASSHPAMMDHEGVWRKVYCRYESSGAAYAAPGNFPGASYMWPSGAINSSYARNTSFKNYQAAVASNADGSPSLTPIYFTEGLNNGYEEDRQEDQMGLFFQLDGVYLIGDDNPLVPESEVTVDGDTYIIFPNGTNQIAGEWVAIYKG